MKSEFRISANWIKVPNVNLIWFPPKISALAQSEIASCGVLAHIMLDRRLFQNLPIYRKPVIILGSMGLVEDHVKGRRLAAIEFRQRNVLNVWRRCIYNNLCLNQTLHRLFSLWICSLQQDENCIFWTSHNSHITDKQKYRNLITWYICTFPCMYAIHGYNQCTNIHYVFSNTPTIRHTVVCGDLSRQTVWGGRSTLNGRMAGGTMRCP